MRDSRPDDLTRGFLKEMPEPERYAVDRADPVEALGMIAARVDSGSRVLDVGCGNGGIARSLMDLVAADVVGIEPQPERVAIARARGVEVVEGYFEAAGVAGLGRFDVVLFADILEHLTSPAHALDLARSLLTPRGRVIASIPNVAHWSVRLDLLRGRFRYEPQGILDATHLRWFTEETVRSLFAATDFEVESVALTHGSTLLLYKQRPPWRFMKRKLRRRIISLGIRTFPRVFGGQFIVVARPRRPAFPDAVAGPHDPATSG